MKNCEHKNTKGFSTTSFQHTDIEVCLDCGCSRSVSEQVHSDWMVVDLGKNAIDIKTDIERFLSELTLALLNHLHNNIRKGNGGL